MSNVIFLIITNQLLPNLRPTFTVIYKNIIDIFFPKLCVSCDDPVTSSEILCIKCIHILPLTNHFNHIHNEVLNRFYGRLPVEWASALCFYQKKGLVQQLIQKLKYKGIEKIGTTMGAYAAHEMLKSDQLPHITDVVPVPLHPKKIRERGYNQVETFAKEIATRLDVLYSPQYLKRNFYNKTQTKKNLFARTSLNKELFSVGNNIPEGRHFLLVDDVITSGATLEACGNALLKAPHSKISILCMAMSV